MRTQRWFPRFATATVMAVGVLAVAPVLLDAILVAPHAVFMDHRSRTGQIYLVNTGMEPEEVLVDLRYGYPDADSVGNVIVRFIDSAGPGEPSAAAWIRAFPRRATVRPGERQAVRLMAQPPADLPDGEYWSRVVVTSRPQPDVAAGDTAVRANVRVELRTVISLTYRKGAVHTSIALDGFTAAIESDSLVVWTGLHRGGNAAWLGTLEIALRDGFGREVETWTTPTAVYADGRRRTAHPLPALQPGPYTVRVRLSTARLDLPASSVLPAPPVVDSVQVQVR